MAGLDSPLRQSHEMITDSVLGLSPFFYARIPSWVTFCVASVTHKLRNQGAMGCSSAIALGLRLAKSNGKHRTRGASNQPVRSAPEKDVGNTR